MRIPTDHDPHSYPHVFFTSPDIWDTSELDRGIPTSLLEDINQHSDDSLLQDSNFDAYGEPHHRDIQTLNSSYCDLPSLPPGEPTTHVHLHDIKTSPNLRLDPPKGEDQPQDLTSDVSVYGRPNPAGSDNTPPMSIINFDDLLGRTFLLPMDENGERKRATISEHVKTDTSPLEDGFYRFKCIKDYKGPYTSSDPEYNGSSSNLLIEWETGEQTWEPLSNIIASDPYTWAVYDKKHDLLNTPGWKLSKRHSKDNNKWKEATDLELEQIKEYQVFNDLGREKAVHDKKHITKGHQKIRVHFVFDVKHCGKFKARLLADGHFTKEPMETVYSGMFLTKPNNLELWGADAGHAYNLQALTREKFYTVGSPEYWHDKFFEMLHIK